ncbi:MAG: hypothetical protein G4V63_25750, partial [Candidatus Afipia apatlaquensis]|nr:hypothetical protein [Candidatus Afipia apatlaquensis]
LVKALEIGVSDLEFILNELIAVRPGSYRASNTLTEMRAALAAAKTGGALDPVDTKTALENGDSR